MSKIRRDLNLPRKTVLKHEAITLEASAVKPIKPESRADRKLAVEPGARLVAKEWVELSRGLPELIQEKLKRGWETGVGLTLSPRHPVLEEGGQRLAYLNGYQIQVYDPNSPALWFVYGQGILEIWLENLEVGAGYTLEVRLTGYGGQLRIGTSETPAAFINVGYQMTAPIFLPSVDSTMALVRIEAASDAVSWGFFDAVIRRVT